MAARITLPFVELAVLPLFDEDARYHVYSVFLTWAHLAGKHNDGQVKGEAKTVRPEPYRREPYMVRQVHHER